MKYYCWRCDGIWIVDCPKHHDKLHEMLDDMRAFGTATCSLKDLGYNFDSKVTVKPKSQYKHLNLT